MRLLSTDEFTVFSDRAKGGAFFTESNLPTSYLSPQTRGKWLEIAAEVLKTNERIHKTLFFALRALQNSTRTNCRKAGHGTVLVKDGVAISDGFNGVPRDCEHPTVCKRLNTQSGADYEACDVPCIHSETNAIFNAARIGVSTLGAEAYITGEPCINCVSALHQAGINKIMFLSGRPMPEHKGIDLAVDLNIEVWYIHFVSKEGCAKYMENMVDVLKELKLNLA